MMPCGVAGTDGHLIVNLTFPFALATGLLAAPGEPPERETPPQPAVKARTQTVNAKEKKE